MFIVFLSFSKFSLSKSHKVEMKERISRRNRMVEEGERGEEREGGEREKEKYIFLVKIVCYLKIYLLHVNIVNQL